MTQRIIDRSYVGEVLQHIYDSDLDINLSIISRSGYFYCMTGDKRIPLQGRTIEEAISHLAFRLAKEFPGSEFAGWWVNNFRQEDYRR